MLSYLVLMVNFFKSDLEFSDGGVMKGKGFVDVEEMAFVL
jgi:calcineurin-like phosphoesterase family protein